MKENCQQDKYWEELKCFYLNFPTMFSTDKSSGVVRTRCTSQIRATGGEMTMQLMLTVN